MQVHFGLGALSAEWAGAVACVGTFDGVHLGHRQVIGTAVAQSRARDLPCVLVTFDRHPAAVLAPEKCPLALSSLEQNLRIFESLGVSVSVILPFDFALSQLSAEEFLQAILIGKLRASSVVIGHDFAMGHNRRGDAAWLSSHIETTVVAPFEVDGRRVSSSEIRDLVTQGNVEAAATLLGRPYELSGLVVQGQRLGRQLGYPTANLARSMKQLIPADGVYASVFSFAGGRYNAAVSIGLRPAVGGTSRTVEAFLLDYPGDSLYGTPCHLSFFERIREERNFDSLEALSKQIGLDVQQVHAIATSLQT